jgi:hypothetical protein
MGAAVKSTASDDDHSHVKPFRINLFPEDPFDDR